MTTQAAVRRKLSVDEVGTVFRRGGSELGRIDRYVRMAGLSNPDMLWEAARKTILFVTHAIDEAVQRADRVVMMAARPAGIRRIIDVNVPHPRDLSSMRYVELRDGILEEIGLADKL